MGEEEKGEKNKDEREEEKVAGEAKRTVVGGKKDREEGRMERGRGWTVGRGGGRRV